MAVKFPNKVKLSKSSAKLDRTTKAVLEQAVKIISKKDGWVKGAWIIGENGLPLPSGYPTYVYDNELLKSTLQAPKVKQACAIGAVQRATWEVLGKPDMGVQKNSRKVEQLALAVEIRLDDYVKTLNWRFDPGDGYEITVATAIGFNDAPNVKRGDVIALFKAAGNLA